MYLRFVQVKIKPESVVDIRTMYETKAIPALQQVKGCLYASLIRSEHHADEFVSMTLWEKREDAEAYERGSVFQKLWEEAQPFLAGSSEWKIHLSEDFTLNYEPLAEEPIITTYELPATNGSAMLSNGSFGSLYVRIVSPQIREGKKEEFKQIYHTEILPELRKVKGCRYVYLTENMKDSDHVISITIWDSKHDAENYERSGLFKKLLEKVEHTFSEMHQWRMQLAKETRARIVTSEDLTVEGYSVVTGKSFL